jgi:hypothetical protein
MKRPGLPGRFFACFPEIPLTSLNHRHPEVAAQRPSKGDGPDLGFTRDRQIYIAQIG